MNKDSDLQQKLDAAVKKARLPALAVAVIHGDSIECAVAGVRRKGGKDAVTLSDRWHLGSNTKAMTATMIGLLVQDGILSEDATPLQLLPELQGRIAPEYQGITLTQLLQHRAGIQPYTAGPEFEPLPDFAGDARAQRHAFAEHVLCSKPGGKVGEFLYSNAGYAIAAALAEAASASTFEDLMQDRLLAPLGIEARWGWPALEPDQPWGHGPGLFGLQVHEDLEGYKLDDFVAPAGNLSMSIGDYSVFVQSHLRGLQGLAPLDKAGQPLAASEDMNGLNSALIKQLHEPDGNYSFGWGEIELEGRQVSMHEGSAGTFDALTIIEPASDTAVVVLCNAGGDKVSSAVGELCKELLFSAARKAPGESSAGTKSDAS